MMDGTGVPAGHRSDVVAVWVIVRAALKVREGIRPSGSPVAPVLHRYIAADQAVLGRRLCQTHVFVTSNHTAVCLNLSTERVLTTTCEFRCAVTFSLLWTTQKKLCSQDFLSINKLEWFWHVHQTSKTSLFWKNSWSGSHISRLVRYVNVSRCFCISTFPCDGRARHPLCQPAAWYRCFIIISSGKESFRGVSGLQHTAPQFYGTRRKRDR